MIQLVILFILNSYLQTCDAVIYRLNDSEYDRMPPLFALDQYDTCLRSVNGTYCMAQFKLHAEPGNKLMKLIQEYSADTTKHYDHRVIDRGVCVSKTCKDFATNKNLNKRQDLEAVLEVCLNETVYKSYGIQTKLAALFYCDKSNDRKVISNYDWMIISIFVGLVMINLVGSWCDIVGKNHDNEFLMSFSLLRNYKWLVTPDSSDPRFEQLKGLYGVKTCTTILMISAHIMIMNAGFIDNPHDFEKAYDSVHYQFIFNGMAIVQIFFLISGFLMMYTLKIKHEDQLITWRTVPKIIFLRWWRLTPAIAVMIGFNVSLLHHLGSGPLWNLYVTEVTTGCRAHWWEHLLYINNYVPENKFCAMHTWHVSADFQLFFACLLVYAATVNRRRNLALALLFLLGLCAPVLHVYMYDLDGQLIMNPECYRTLSNDNFWYLHILGHNNFTCFIMGMAVGHLLYHWQKTGVKLVKNKALGYLYWLWMPALAVLFYSGSQFYEDRERDTLIKRMTYMVIHRLLMGCIATFGLVGLLMKFEDVLSGIFEWRGWLVPGRLTYSVYLLHMNIVHILLGSRTQLGHVSFFYMLIVYFGVTVMSFLIAAPFCLMVEAPMNRLMKAWMTKQKNILSSEQQNGKKIK